MLLATRPSLFGPSSVAAHCPLSPQGPCGDGLSHALFFLFSQGFPLPPSCPLKRLGSDHLDVWALPRGQGGSEGGQLLPAPTLSPGPLCCLASPARLAPGGRGPAREGLGICWNAMEPGAGCVFPSP